MYILIAFLIIAIAINLSPLGKKGRTAMMNYWTTGKAKFDDYDEEQKNIDKLSR